MTISPPCTTADREKSGGVAKRETETTNTRGGSALSRMAPVTKIETQGGDKLSKDQLRRQRKSKAFFAALQARRQTPGNCRRCGKPHADKTRKICAKCRAHHNEYYRRKAALKHTNDKALYELQRRVASLEHELSRMLIDRRATYKAGYSAGKQWKRRASMQMHNLDAYPTITKQELATMNHAYAEEAA
jgi:hypothetical protein